MTDSSPPPEKTGFASIPGMTSGKSGVDMSTPVHPVATPLLLAQRWQTVVSRVESSRVMLSFLRHGVYSAVSNQAESVTQTAIDTCNNDMHLKFSYQKLTHKISLYSADAHEALIFRQLASFWLRFYWQMKPEGVGLTVIEKLITIVKINYENVECSL